MNLRINCNKPMRILCAKSSQFLKTMILILVLLTTLIFEFFALFNMLCFVHSVIVLIM